MKFNSIVSLSLLALGQSTHVEDEYKPAVLDGIRYQELATPFVKSENDEREYLGLKLANQMKVLLVSDPIADKAAASVDVMAGSMLDPVGMPGRAHFCEHLLFTGSKKYPGMNDYEGYLGNHAGSSNAYTSYDNTNYHFEVGFDSLEGALDRFAHTFIDPLFSEDRVKKEVNAVNSEFLKDKPLDAYRIDQVQRSFSTSSHPYANFFVGNYSTLYDWQIENGKKPEIEVGAYFEKYYSANLMSLVIGREALDDLKRMVMPRFSQLRNSDIPRLSSKEYPIPKKYLGTELTIVPIADLQYLEMQFYLPSMIVHVKEDPIDFIETLINARGSGSLADQLEEKGWITDLSSGSEYYLDFTVLSVYFQLTPSGLRLDIRLPAWYLNSSN